MYYIYMYIIKWIILLQISVNEVGAFYNHNQVVKNFSVCVETVLMGFKLIPAPRLLQ